MIEAVPTVFVVDDDSGVRKSLGQLMMSVSLPVETFASGPDFLEVIDHNRPGCLVLDLRLKEGSGLEVQDELRRRNVVLPIIVLTGHGNVPDSVRAMKAGAFDFLQKPPPPAVLLERIHSAMECDRSSRITARKKDEALERLAALPAEQRDVIAMLIAGGATHETATDLVIGLRATAESPPV